MQLSDSFILKISLLISVLGLGFLTVYSISLQPIQTSIESISFKDIGQRVSIEAKTIKLQLSEKALIFWVAENNRTLQAVKFSYSLDDLLLLQQNKQVKLTGTIQEYEGKLEIVVEKMEVVD